MRTATRIFALAALLGTAAAATTAAQAGDVAGVVHDGEGAPEAGLQLTIEALARETVSAADGSYRFENLPAGEHEIALHLASGRTQYVTVAVAETGEATRNIFQFTPLALSGLQQAVPAPAPAMEGEAFDAVMELAESMTRAAPQQWRWRDLDS